MRQLAWRSGRPGSWGMRLSEIERKWGMVSAQFLWAGPEHSMSSSHRVPHDGFFYFFHSGIQFWENSSCSSHADRSHMGAVSHQVFRTAKSSQRSPLCISIPSKPTKQCSFGASNWRYAKLVDRATPDSTSARSDVVFCKHFGQTRL